MQIKGSSCSSSGFKVIGRTQQISILLTKLAFILQNLRPIFRSFLLKVFFFPIVAVEYFLMYDIWHAIICVVLLDIALPLVLGISDVGIW
jgi:hypothetical protein